MHLRYYIDSEWINEGLITVISLVYFQNNSLKFIFKNKAINQQSCIILSTRQCPELTESGSKWQNTDYQRMSFWELKQTWSSTQEQEENLNLLNLYLYLNLFTGCEIPASINVTNLFHMEKGFRWHYVNDCPHFLL